MSFVYVYGRPESGRVKVGCTDCHRLDIRDANLRSEYRADDARMLFALRVPLALTNTIETAAHKLLGEFRLTKRGEWFATTFDVAAAAICAAAMASEHAA